MEWSATEGRGQAQYSTLAATPIDVVLAAIRLVSVLVFLVLVVRGWWRVDHVEVQVDVILGEGKA